MKDPEVRTSAFKRLLALLKRPSARYSLGALLLVGFAAGVIFWGGFNTVLEATNTEAFCLSCHEMRDNVYPEYQQTIHYSNRTGVRATCPDCHVPKEWTYKMVRKIQASRELWGKLVGTIDTPEKFEAKRLQLARSEWARMKAADSRECRNCHSLDSMNAASQKQRARKQHEMAREDNMTCIDCHKGIAHRKPQGMTEEDEG
ncbi:MULTISPECIES: NapC/NirT family cytochrome c [Pseudomonas]|uniref:Cytochrome c-type protein n=1 Tax=Pseudomonas flexibilis TaxID=706570 RepID=A0A1N6ZKP6_9PSED|nr:MULTISPECIES: NapC/NirT family cytochrome c [Pseudomonas]KHL67938.1 cytochrome C protein NapC [Pseudomonas flexibilis]SCY35482.1 cytochrome c-type protein NapC [Pseudomonas flexibilis]SIR27365.1 cytochrome c-type protein NapC [Pseudomonas flexibilis]